jgi:hypothetical protein
MPDIEKEFLLVTNETEWKAVVWDYMYDRKDEYPDTDAAFDDAENAILDTLECDCEAVQHLRELGVVRSAYG